MSTPPTPSPNLRLARLESLLGARAPLTLTELADELELFLGALAASDFHEDVILTDLHPCDPAWVTNSLLVLTRTTLVKVTRGTAMILFEHVKDCLRNGVARGVGHVELKRAEAPVEVALGTRVAGLRWVIDKLAPMEVSKEHGGRLKSVHFMAKRRPAGLERDVQLFYMDVLEAVRCMIVLCDTWDEGVLRSGLGWLAQADAHPTVQLCGEAFTSFLRQTLYGLLICHCLNITPQPHPTTTHWLSNLLARIPILQHVALARAEHAFRHLRSRTLASISVSGASAESPGALDQIAPLVDPLVLQRMRLWMPALPLPFPPTSVTPLTTIAPLPVLPLPFDPPTVDPDHDPALLDHDLTSPPP